MNDVAWCVGIDWGSEHHAVWVMDAMGGRQDERRIAHTAEAVQACLDWLVEYTGVAPAQMAVAIETPRGALTTPVWRAASWCSPSIPNSSIAFGTARRWRARKMIDAMRGSWRTRYGRTPPRFIRCITKIPSSCSSASCPAPKMIWTPSFGA